MNNWFKHNHVRIISGNRDVRYDFAEMMGHIKKIDAGQFKTLSYLANNDPDYLVRINAVESLGQIATPLAIKVLERRLADKHPQVRGYAAQNLAEAVGKGALNALTKLYSRETNRWTRHALRTALFEAGDHGILKRILSGLDANKFHLRAVVLSGIADIKPNRIEKSIIAAALTKRLLRERAPALAGKIRALLGSKYKCTLTQLKMGRLTGSLKRNKNAQKVPKERKATKNRRLGP